MFSSRPRLVVAGWISTFLALIVAFFLALVVPFVAVQAVAAEAVELPVEVPDEVPSAEPTPLPTEGVNEQVKRAQRDLAPISRRVGEMVEKEKISDPREQPRQNRAAGTKPVPISTPDRAIPQPDLTASAPSIGLERSREPAVQDRPRADPKGQPSGSFASVSSRLSHELVFQPATAPMLRRVAEAIAPAVAGPPPVQRAEPARHATSPVSVPGATWTLSLWLLALSAALVLAHRRAVPLPLMTRIHESARLVRRR